MGQPREILAGRTALVTGAAKRLGRTTALALARAGADVVVHYGTSAEQADATAREIRAAGRRAWTLQADLADGGAARSLPARAAQATGALDILINSASIFPANGVMDFSGEDLSANIAVNAMAPLELSRGLAAHLAGRTGDIVNFLDCRVADYDRLHAAYHLSKRMLLSLTKMLALELAPTIRVNGVAPGLILPPPGQDDSYLATQAHTTPLRRHGSPQQVADAVVFLLGCDFITGQVIFVDGGRHLKGNVYG